MIVNTKNVFEEYVDEIDSFDAFYKNVVFDNNNLLIPYVNLGISNHPLNSSSDLKFIDFSYMVFENIKFLNVYICNKRLGVKKSNSSIDYPKYHFGGEYLDYNTSIFNDLEIQSERVFLQTLDITKISDKMWVLKPGSDLSISLEYTKYFFDLFLLPENIKELFPRLAQDIADRHRNEA